MGLFKKIFRLEKSKEDKEKEELIDDISNVAKHFKTLKVNVYPKSLKSLDKKALKVMRDTMGKQVKSEELHLAQEGITNFITIKNSGSAEAFNEVVKMFCNELHDLLKLKINPNDFIKESNLKNVKIKSKFSFTIPTEGISETEAILLNTAKKNVQLKIKGNKRYKDIELLGSIKFVISPENLPNLLKIIENDERLKAHSLNYPIFLNMQLAYYTSIFDYDRFVDFAKKINDYLDLTRVDYKDIRKRIIDAVDENLKDITRGINEKLSEKDKLDFKKVKQIYTELAEQGAIKLIYLRNYTWDIELALKKKSDLLNKLSNLTEFMQSTLKSKDVHKDFLIPTFEISTDFDFVPAYGCYEIINNKAGIDESIFSLPFPDTAKKL